MALDIAPDSGEQSSIGFGLYFVAPSDAFRQSELVARLASASPAYWIVYNAQGLSPCPLPRPIIDRSWSRRGIRRRIRLALRPENRFRSGILHQA